MTDQDHSAIWGFTPPEELRAFRRDNRKPMTDKRCTAREAVERFVKDSDYLGIGGFGTNRIPTPIIHEIVRQRRKGLGFAGHTATHDCQVLVAGDCIARCDVAYVVGLEARGRVSSLPAKENYIYNRYIAVRYCTLACMA